MASLTSLPVVQESPEEPNFSVVALDSAEGRNSSLVAPKPFVDHSINYGFVPSTGNSGKNLSLKIPESKGKNCLSKADETCKEVKIPAEQNDHVEAFGNDWQVVHDQPNPAQPLEMIGKSDMTDLVIEITITLETGVCNISSKVPKYATTSIVTGINKFDMTKLAAHNKKESAIILETVYNISSKVPKMAKTSTVTGIKKVLGEPHPAFASGPPIRTCPNTGSGSGAYGTDNRGTGGSPQESSSYGGNNGKESTGGCEGRSGGTAGGGGGRENGDGDDSRKKPLSSGDVEMQEENEEDDEEDSGDCSMPTLSSEQSPDNAANMSPVEQQQASVNQSHYKGANMSPVEQQQASVNQDISALLQHSYYCAVDCGTPNCHKIKLWIRHFDEHYNNNPACQHCSQFYGYLQSHASICKVIGCRVALCNNLRNAGGGARFDPNHVLQNVAQNAAVVGPVSVPPGPANAEPAREQLFYNTMRHYQPIPRPGLVLFSNEGEFPQGSMFRKGLDFSYARDESGRKSICGRGANGAVFKVIVGGEIRVVKKTNYPIGRQEIDVYRAIGGGHPNIVKTCLITMRDNRRANIFMEFCDTSVRRYLDWLEVNHLWLSMAEIMFFWTKALSAVDFLHDLGIIHKDIKTGNMLLSIDTRRGEFNRVMLADYDSALLLEGEVTQAGLTPQGTRGFAAPEVLNRSSHGLPADIYSLGVCGLELTGTRPSENYDRLIEQVDELDDTLYGPFKAVINSCIRQEPADRPTAKKLLGNDFVGCFQFLNVPANVPDAV